MLGNWDIRSVSVKMRVDCEGDSCKLIYIHVIFLFWVEDQEL